MHRPRHVGANPSATASEHTRHDSSQRSRPTSPRPDVDRRICPEPGCIRDVATARAWFDYQRWRSSPHRPPSPDRGPGSSGSALRDPALHDVDPRTEVPGLLPGGAGVPTECDQRVGPGPANRHTRRQLKETTPSATATRRERTSAAEDHRLGTEVPRQRPPTLEARSHTAHASGPSGGSPRRSRHPRCVIPAAFGSDVATGTARWFQHTSGCHPCRHGRRRNPLGSTPSGVPPGR